MQQEKVNISIDDVLGKLNKYWLSTNNKKAIKIRQTKTK